MQSIDLNAGGSSSFAFDNHGDTCSGRVVNLEELQQTDLNTGQPKTFDNGQPMIMYRVELQTELRDDTDDDGVRSVYLKGSKKPESGSSLAAVLSAVKQATGRYSLSVGGTLSLTYVGDGQARQRGHNAPKLYQATYQAPSLDLGGGQQAPQQQAAWDQPAHTAPAGAQPQQAPAPQSSAAPAPQPTQQASQSVWGAPQPQAPAPQQAPQGSQPTEEQVAAIRAAGMDPAQVFPGFAG